MTILLRSALVALIPFLLAAQETPGSSGRQTPGPPALKPEDLCAIEGQVVNAVTGEPIKNAALTIRRDTSAPSATGSRQKYASASDSTGKFAFANIVPGSYWLSATRTGFVDAEYGQRNPNGSGTTISLDAGKHKSDPAFRMIPHGVISGRVTTEDGEPAAAMEVHALYYSYPQGKKRLASYDSATTNDRGEYRVYGLAPGRYYLSATAPENQAVQKAAHAPDQPIPQYVNTYYPRASDLGAASPLDVGPGMELSGMNIELSKQPTLSVKGRVIDASNSGLKKLMVYLMPRESVAFSLTRNTSSVERDGSFEIGAVIPGSYTLVATLWDQERGLAARLPLDVGKNNIEGATIVLNPVIKVSGRVRLDTPADEAPAKTDGQASVDFTKLEVGLEARDTNARRFIWVVPAQAKEDGSFGLSDVTPEDYSVTLSGLPDGFYVKAIRLNNQEKPASELDLTAGATGPVDIVLSPHAGQVTGMVKDDKDQPAADATVVLIPQEKERRDNRQYYKTATTDASGRFVSKSLAPGRYKAYAWDYIDPGKYVDPDFMQPLEDRGKPVAIQESSQEDLELKLIR